MLKLDDEHKLFRALLSMLGQQFGEKTEIVLHDWSKGYDHSIVDIENADVTGRKIGDCGSNLGLSVIRGTETDDLRCNYVTHTKDGKTLKSSTMYIKDENGTPLGALCINTDISDYVDAQRALGKIIPKGLQTSIDDEFFASDVNDLLLYLISKGIEQVSKPVNDMTRNDKKRVIQFLDEKGAFLINKSGPSVCEALDISKFTLYNYLEKIRNNKEEQ